MTAFEFFKDQYDKNHDYMVEGMHKEIPVDSFHFVEVAWKYCFGCTTDVDVWYNIAGVDDTHEMLEKKYLKRWEAGNPRKRYVALTKKGLRAFYKAMF